MKIHGIIFHIGLSLALIELLFGSCNIVFHTGAIDFTQNRNPQTPTKKFKSILYSIQGGPVPATNGVITRINGLIDG